MELKYLLFKLLKIDEERIKLSKDQRKFIQNVLSILFLKMFRSFVPLDISEVF